MSGLKANGDGTGNNLSSRLVMTAKKISGYKEPVKTETPKTETPLNPVMIGTTKKKVFSTTSGSSGRSLLGG